MLREFSGRVAVVTGAASGMGRAFAQRFAEEGMRVVLADVEREPLDRAVAELRAAGFEAVGVPADVSSRPAVEALAAAALDAFGSVQLGSTTPGWRATWTALCGRRRRRTGAGRWG
jgi:NAD(P)-dependent dehydrogenase (short-subunit alcohol dehydrogenase family)